MPRYNERQILIRKGERGKDSLVDEILDNPEGSQGKAYAKALEIFETKLKRRYVEATLLCGNNFLEMSGILEIEPEVLELYNKVFYNVVGLDRLTKLDIVDGAKAKDKDDFVLKTWALSQGTEFIAWRLGKVISISPVDGLTDLFNTCIYKSKEAMFNGNSSTASVESTKWVKLSVDIARLLKMWVIDSQEARKDIELAIKEVLPTFKSLDDLVVEAEEIENQQEINED